MAIGVLGSSLIGGGLSAIGGILGGREQADATENAARMSQFRPTNVTSGYGSVGATMTGRDVYGNPIYSYNQTLDPRYQSIRDQLLGSGTTLFNQAGMFDPRLASNLGDIDAARAQSGALFQRATGYDPQQFGLEQGRLFTNQLRQDAAPIEKQQQLDLENRLFQQGILTGSSGAQRMGELQKAQASADVQRQLQGQQAGWGMAQDVQRNLAGQYGLGLQNVGMETALRNQLLGEKEGLFQQGLGQIQAGTAVEGLPGNLMQQSIGASGGQQNAGANAAQFTYNAGQSRGDMISGFFGSLGQGFSNYSFGGGGGQPIYGADPLFNYQQQYNFQGNMAPQSFG